MIAVDTSILVYAHREDSPFHVQAFRCIAELAESRASWSIPWPCLHEFMAITTHPKIFSPPSPLAAAVAQVEAWLESPSLVLLSEERDHWSILQRIINASKATGPLVHDARIAALCLSHGIKELLTADRDFGRFRDLKTRNPLVEKP
jgi:uncharacterized protein